MTASGWPEPISSAPPELAGRVKEFLPSHGGYDNEQHHREVHRYKRLLPRSFGLCS
jgi:hypothetical protein